MKRSLLLFILYISLAQDAWSHEVRPAYLEIRQTSAETYDVLWKVPGLGDNMRFGLYLELPARCSNLTNPRGIMINNSFTERWSMKCERGLDGDTIRIAGLSGTMTDVLVRLERLDGSMQIMRLTPSAPLFVVAAQANAMGVVRSYTLLGIEHILTGIDHLLFVLALLIITHGGWKLVKTVTAFTVSHTLSLSLATLGYVHIPSKPVEAIIALSIVFVAAEILRQRQGHLGITARSPWIVALIFGLMHGLGFAGGLSEAGLPEGHIPTALLFFSIGVETGHFLFIGLVLMLMATIGWVTKKLIPLSEQRLSLAQLIPPYIIGSLAMFWVIERIVAF
ncbi:MAG: HupE/UreJ family protein [Cyclobacteriaceae bacterium]